MTVYLYCLSRGTLLTEPPVHDRGQWVIPCLACRAENLLEPTVQVTGWRPS